MRAFCMSEEGWPWHAFVTAQLCSGNWLGHLYLSFVPAAATVAEHRHKQQQRSMQCILVLAGRRATDVEIRDLCAGSGDFQLGE